MNVKLDCFSCFLRMGLQAARMAGVEEEKEKDIMVEFLDILKTSTCNDNPLKIAIEIQKIVHKHSQNDDPYAALKKECNTTAEAWLPQLEEALARSDNKLSDALKYAVIGNIMDYGAFSEFDLDSLFKKLHQKNFHIDDSPRFIKQLKTAKTLTYFADNTGEIVFDALLIEHLCQAYPIKELNLVIRDRPFFNDVSSPDDLPTILRTLKKPINIVPLSIVFEEHDEHVWNNLITSDVIIAKGMANFEKFSELESFFFLFISKCDLVSQEISKTTNKQTKTGDWIFMHGRQMNHGENK